MSDSDNMMPPPPPRQKTTQAAPAVTEEDDNGDRHMNDSTMTQPSRSPQQAATTTTKAAAPSSQQQSKKRYARNKIGGGPRFGLHDWKRLLLASNDLAQTKGAGMRRGISWEEVAQHHKPHDGWMVLRGKVYNIGPYLAYHPGGINVMKKALGKDATALFDKFHRWVNIEGLIGPLCLGTVEEKRQRVASKNPFSVVPPKESHLTNAPRVSIQTAKSSLLSSQDDEDEEEDLLPPPPTLN